VEEHAQAANLKEFKAEWIRVAGAAAADICNVF
jgi:hypothetical protein